MSTSIKFAYPVPPRDEVRRFVEENLNPVTLPIFAKIMSLSPIPFQQVMNLLVRHRVSLADVDGLAPPGAEQVSELAAGMEGEFTPWQSEVSSEVPLANALPSIWETFMCGTPVDSYTLEQLRQTTAASALLYPSSAALFYPFVENGGDGGWGIWDKFEAAVANAVAWKPSLVGDITPRVLIGGSRTSPGYSNYADFLSDFSVKVLPGLKTALGFTSSLSEVIPIDPTGVAAFLSAYIDSSYRIPQAEGSRTSPNTNPTLMSVAQTVFASTFGQLAPYLELGGDLAGFLIGVNGRLSGAETCGLLVNDCLSMICPDSGVVRLSRESCSLLAATGAGYIGDAYLEGQMIAAQSWDYARALASCVSRLYWLDQIWKASVYKMGYYDGHLWLWDGTPGNPPVRTAQDGSVVTTTWIELQSSYGISLQTCTSLSYSPSPANQPVFTTTYYLSVGGSNQSNLDGTPATAFYTYDYTNAPNVVLFCCVQGSSYKALRYQCSLLPGYNQGAWRGLYAALSEAASRVASLLTEANGLSSGMLTVSL